MNIATAVAAFTVPLASLGMVIAIVWLIARARQRRNELRADVQMKLIEKTRSGSKVTRRYDTARTPYQRILASEQVAASVKRALRRQYLELNPVALQREIGRCHKRLLALARRRKKPPTGNKPTHPWNQEVIGHPLVSRTSSVRQRKDRLRTS